MAPWAWASVRVLAYELDVSHPTHVHPNWWLNMVANPEVTLRVNDQVIKARMQEITNPADRDRIWHNVVASGKGYANYPKKTSRVIPLGLLRPVS